MSAKSRARKRRKEMKWVDGPNGTATLKDLRSEGAKAQDAFTALRCATFQATVASGINPSSGCGAHGKSKEQHRKSDRRKAKLDLRRGGDE